MIELGEWWRRQFLDSSRPWLVLGKGPTLADYDPNQCDYSTFGLNHVVEKIRVDVAHAIDIEVIADCESIIESNCRYLLMPYVPNVQFACGQRPITEFFDVLPVLRRLSDQDRLVWYNLRAGNGERRHPTITSPQINARFFSIEAALNILGQLGVKQVRSYGIDGGASYSTQFQHLERKTLLANGRQRFDKQFIEMAKIVKKHNMEYSPMSEPMRVFVGTDDSQMVAAKVLEHSIKKYATRPVQVTHMLNLEYPALTNPKIKPGTGFSFARFKIPELAGYRGRAMYCDADMQVFGDLSELWNIPFGDQRVLCTRQDYIPDVWKGNPAFTPGRQMSVMLLDCDRLTWKIEDIIDGLNSEQFSYKQLMTELCMTPQEEIRDDISPAWNSLEHYEPENTRLLHYTNVPTQPWKNANNPLTNIWMEGFDEAVRAGTVRVDLVSQSVLAGYIRPELLERAMTITKDTAPVPDELNAARGQLWEAIKIIREQDEAIQRLRQSPIKRLVQIARSVASRLKSKVRVK